MTRDPMVSVILRTKDRPLLLRRALASVLSQTLDSWYVLLVDDGTTSEAVDGVVAELGLEGDARLRVIRRDEPFGRPGALNAGLAVVETPFWAIHDDDDTWAPDFLSTAVDRLGDDPSAGAIAVRTAVVNERIDNGSIIEIGREVLAAEVHHVTLEELLKGNKFPPISLVWRTSATREVGGFADDLTVLEDWEFTLRLAARHPVAFADGEPLAFWHQRPASTDSSANSVVAEASAHAAYDALVRDRFMRQDPSGIGTALAVAGLLEEGRKRDETARAEQSRVMDQWANAINEHLEVSRVDLKLEIGRLRGEVISLRRQLEEQRAATTRQHRRIQQAIRSLQPQPQPTLRRRARTRAGQVARRAGFRRSAKG